MAFFVFDLSRRYRHICIVIKKQTATKPMNQTKNRNRMIRWVGQSLWLVAMLLFFENRIIAQEREFAYGTMLTDESYGLVQADNGDLILSGFGEFPQRSAQVLVVRVDVDGDLVWQRNFGGSFQERGFDILKSGNTYLIAGDKKENFTDEFDGLLLKINEHGDELWMKSYGGLGLEKFNAVIQTSDGGYAAVGITKSVGNGEGDLYLVKTDADGDTLWTAHFDNDAQIDEAKDLVETSDGFVIVGKSGNVGGDIFLLKTDLNGLETRRILFNDPNGSFDPAGIAETEDGDFLIAGSYTDFGIRAFVQKVLANFRDGGRDFYDVGIEQGFNFIQPTRDGNFVAAGYLLDDNQSPLKAYAVKVDKNKNRLNTHISGKTVNRQLYGVVETADSLLAFAGVTFDNQFVTDFLLLKTDFDLYLPNKFIEGKVFFDLNNNCQLDPGETPLKGWMVEVAGTDQTYYFTTDAAGNYSARLDSASYKVNIYVNNEYWRSCFNGNGISFIGQVDTVHLNFPIQPLHACSYLEVDVSAPFVKKCENTIYKVSYCNHGVIDAANAHIEVEMDEYLTVINTSIPIAGQTGNLFRFNLGTVAAGQCGEFFMTALLDCDEPFDGQTHCVRAHIFPDSICRPASPSWDGATLAVEGRCENDTIKFTIKNDGNGNMVQGKQALIVEDEILIRIVPVMLDTNKTATIDDLVGLGKTYRLIVEQSTGHPGKSNPTVAVEGCAQTGSEISKGVVNQFEEDEKNAFVAIECLENSTDSDYNDLRGYPKGIYDSLITQKTDLEYQIRFQNVGTDSIDRVVIRDTIPAGLDITTLRPGAASHPYQYRVYDHGVVKFIFEKISLPGSSVNEAASVGFVKYRITQKPNNPNGTIIVNHAAINAGYRLQTKTNPTRHVIAGATLLDFITTDVGEVFVPGVAVNFYPNPLHVAATFEMKGKPFGICTFELFDLAGKPVRQESFSENRFEFERKDLPAGVYFYRVTTSDGQLINVGKIMAVSASK